MRNQMIYMGKIQTNPPLGQGQMGLLQKLNAFAEYQASHDHEVRQMPAKIIYKINAELKLALIALMTTCSLLDPNRHGSESETYFEKEIKIIQQNSGQKYIDFGRIRPFLIQNFLIPEIVDDWILYRDVAGDGIHALMDRKTALQGLSTYARGGTPVYEFSRFYRKFMENKIAKKNQTQEDFKKIAMKTLTEQIISSQLAQGHSASEILDHIMNDNLLELTTLNPQNPLLPKK